jgi:Tfp pilus assembly protein PilV
MNTPSSSRRLAAGVSLIEALVALAVMAFGILGVVGMQSTLRSNADLSRQRSEAVRIAQEEIERLRNFAVLRASDAASGQFSFEEIVAAPSASAAASDANTTFLIQTLVPGGSASDPLADVRQVRVLVSWADRSTTTPNQQVELTTAIAAFPPEVSALHAMRTDRTPLQQPFGRHSAVPPAATNNGDGTSSFLPPGLTGVTWVFNNATGFITQICSPICVTGNRWLLSGIVAFAIGDEPGSSEAEVPSDPVVTGLTIGVLMSQPSAGTTVTCATQTVGTNRLSYFCAVPTTATAPRTWSGRIVFGGIPIADTLSVAAETSYKVCRYTPDERQITALADIPVDESLSSYNSRHPYSFWRVSGPQQNKNFLVISAGNGSTPFSCPDENTATLIESNTWPHAPIS